ncbi:sensor histidine kinase NtrY-like [Frigidibacter sp. ROC022]|uniref:sensor histidine kinase NtrY-like n=1 Tax=Frigidibacter sp. ROC022 TaxID=2971796 RepID=UPI00215B4B0A|nr:PAS domain-containing sensor histidine kinase [Frigidibacter sp. ROC022]MCR8723448.1 PAS domain-containing sensor histidine kinase [Frigidibacter sp. ROC022]
MRKLRRVQNAATLGLVLLGPVLTAATFAILGPLDQGASALSLRLILLADLVYVLAIAALVMQRVAKMIADRRAKSAGSRLHLRLTGVFALIALIPTVLVAVFAGLTVNVGLEGWFSDRVRTVLGTSLAAAQAYEGEHRSDLIADIRSLSDYLNTAREANFFVSDGELRQLLTQAQANVQRGLREAYVIDGNGEIKSRGERSYLFDFEKPTQEQISRAAAGEVVVIEDWDQNEFRALMVLKSYPDRYVYVSRAVDGEILSLLDDTTETVTLYNQLESQRGRIVFEFALLYLGFAVILILAATWLGLWFAERLSRPVGRLTGAAQRVGAGDLDVRVVEEDGDDEIAMLGRIFNQMTRQLKGQRDALMDNAAQIERRRRLFDSVLGSVTSGVVGLDAEARVAFVNRSAETLLEVVGEPEGRTLSELAPEFAPLLARLTETGASVAQEEIKLTRHGKMENLLVRIATRRATSGEPEGFVIAFDDVTDLVSAQRMAAWGDVARRIAHEIKNPLTPIQLSAERIKRKFRAAAGDEAAELDQMTDVIVRQTNDLRRIVDEFSKFARMPEPELRTHDLLQLLRDKLVLQEGSLEGLRLVSDLPETPVPAMVDETMIGQALTNLLKNAVEAIESAQEDGVDPDFVPEIRVTMERQGSEVLISISDNGIGLPADRSRLFEPYVTTRAKGTGLGLPIVKKIIEEHGGTLILTDAEPFKDGARRGARAEVRLPVEAVTAGQEDGAEQAEGRAAE